MHMCQGEWDEENPITGLKCVGTVEACPSGGWSECLMGGMSRTHPGRYGESLSLIISQYYRRFIAPAWVCLFPQLNLKSRQKLLIRGATSTDGQAALHPTVHAGAIVTATTRRNQQIGAVNVIREQDGLVEYSKTQEECFDKVLNLISNRVIVRSIALTRRGGRLAQDFEPMVEMKVGDDRYIDAKPVKVFKYDEIHRAQRALDSHDTGGKIVVAPGRSWISY
ncbi:hypothetical protein DFH05DRAFT_1536284 [Lentinula detonsa]|uniref:Uncharacterized protein n=1 Tax=Lentinula detonsa TaxID=2804962 RepID=A0A9W8NWK6_9AGAR|nr:hypothetical protein DFH05DRAFT_1536284 [Lentinula detonsa]